MDSAARARAAVERRAVEVARLKRNRKALQARIRDIAFERKAKAHLDKIGFRQSDLNAKALLRNRLLLIGRERGMSDDQIHEWADRADEMYVEQIRASPVRLSPKKLAMDLMDPDGPVVYGRLANEYWNIPGGATVQKQLAREVSAYQMVKDIGLLQETVDNTSANYLGLVGAEELKGSDSDKVRRVVRVARRSLTNEVKRQNAERKSSERKSAAGARRSSSGSPPGSPRASRRSTPAGARKSARGGRGSNGRSGSTGSNKGSATRWSRLFQPGSQRFSETARSSRPSGASPARSSGASPRRLTGGPGSRRTSRSGSGRSSRSSSGSGR